MNILNRLTRIQVCRMQNGSLNQVLKMAYSTAVSRLVSTPGWTINQSLQMSTPPSSIIGTTAIYMPCRFKARGNTYQPSNVKRKRKYGLHARLRRKSGLAVLLRRIIKGRTILTH